MLFFIAGSPKNLSIWYHSFCAAVLTVLCPAWRVAKKQVHTTRPGLQGIVDVPVFVAGIFNMLEEERTGQIGNISLKIAVIFN